MPDIQKDIGGFRFEWDADKARLNIRKHGISFEHAALVFDDPYMLELYDRDHSFEERRSLGIGNVDNILSVVFVERQRDRIRLISARKATAYERRIYLEQFD